VQRRVSIFVTCERFTLRFAFLLGFSIVSLVGCGTQDEITRYSITAPQGPVQIQPATAGSLGGAVANAERKRMLAAILPQGEETWFFKLTGQDEAVAKQQEQFSALIESVRFTGEMALPVWDLPAGWQQQSASGMRFATIQIEEGGQTLELTVIPLQTMGDVDEYVLGNVNRWRGQLGLVPVAEIKPSDKGDASSSVRQFELPDTTQVTLVNLVGRGSGSDALAAGFEMANHPPIGDVPLSNSASPPDNDGSFTYTTPDGWSPIAAGGMRRAAFKVSEGEREVEVTVITLPQSGGERLSNVNRWRQQIQLSDTTADQLANDIQKISLASASGDYVKLVGPEEAILAVLADFQGTTWFFKLKGNADLAEQERERFEAFVQSVKFSAERNGSPNE